MGFFRIASLRIAQNFIATNNWLSRRPLMRKSGYYYVYPAYFEAGRSRQAGRRVPKTIALDTVNVPMIKDAAQRIGLECTIEPKAKYPSSWWGTPGLVLIKKQTGRSKIKILKELAKTMKALKAAGAL